MATDANRLQLMEVERAYEKMTALVGTLRVTDGDYNRGAMWEYLELLETLGLAFQLNTSDHEADLHYELRINDEGYKLDRNDEPNGKRIHVPAKAFTKDDLK